MEKIGLNEIHKHLLDLAQEFDRVCVNNGIPYYMAYGTMLGAVRHHGFIPWDDDMDFVVPIEHYQRMLNCLEKDLSAPYRCCTHKNRKGLIHCFAKIEDTSTLLDDSSFRLSLEEKLGINIDIFPLNRFDHEDCRIKRVRRKIHLLGAAFSDSKKHTGFIRRFGKSLLALLLGGRPTFLQRSIDRVSYSLNHGDKMGSIFDSPKIEPVPSEWFGKGRRYQFENISLVGPIEYDLYLTHMYGDYMTPPPESQRVAHAESAFLR